MPKILALDSGKDPPRMTLLRRLMSLLGCGSTKRRRINPGRKSQQLEAYAKPPAMRPTVQNFWRFHGAVAEVEKLSQVYRPEELEGDSESEEDEEEVYEEAGLQRLQVKKRLHGYLFSRWPDGSKNKAVSLEGLARDDSQLLEDDVLQNGWDVDELGDAIEKMSITGQEVWLDCLLLAMEEEVSEESPIVEVLRTTGLQDAKDKLKGPQREKLLRFYRRLDQLVRILENKAYKRYFQNLQLESEQRQQFFQQQNEVLHDYVCELEQEFSTLSGAIQNFRGKKEMMLAKLAGLLDRGEYQSLSPKGA